MFLEIIEWQLATSTDGPYDVVYEQIERVPHPITYDRKGTLAITPNRNGPPSDWSKETLASEIAMALMAFDSQGRLERYADPPPYPLLFLRRGNFQSPCKVYST